ncbi:VOC family protein [Phycicoccus flavus]|uniref:VOC family protein n=1 Tax=Phycicoccus flavus TaxID=2502783 RepID=UPI000FEBB2F1|nr:VOC family protein [Phycicoccus flavus]NHA67853.1 VOC family protein [Phycicoccus flavus]
MAVRWTLTIDCDDAWTQAAFWREALGYVDAPAPQGYATWADWHRAFDVPEEEWGDGATLVDPDGAGPSVTFLRVPEPKTVKNRVHLDLQVSGGRDRPADERRTAIAATVERLVAAGATVLAEHEQGGVLDHVVVADPEGNELCVL